MIVRQESFAALAEENAQMKFDLEHSLDKVLNYKYLVEEL